MHPFTPTRPVVLVVAAAAALALSACSADAAKPASAAATPKAGFTAGQARVVPGPKNDIVKRKTVSLSSCRATSTGAVAEGVITNPDDKAVTYAIQVTFTNEKATDLQTKNLKVKADPKGRTAFTATGSFASTPKVRCVLGAIS